MSKIHKIDLLSQEVLELKKQIIDLYLADDDRKFSLGFSGGKDSSLVLAITLEALLEIPKDKLNKTLYVLYSDTLMELLPLSTHTYKVLQNVRDFCAKHGLPVEVMHGKPKLSETMWSLQLGKGMISPSRSNRYCTTRLKTDVQEKILADTFKTDDIETLALVGSRKDESSDRAERLRSNTLNGHLKDHSVYAKSLVFAPIEDFSEADVWSSLNKSKIAHEVIDVKELYVIYSSTNGSGSECSTIIGNASENGKNPGCSGSRFGCWSCGLMYGRDNALEGMKEQYPYIKHLIKFRNWHVSKRDGNWEKNRDVYNHKYFTRLQYNLDNHRFGITTPGGASLKLRAEGLLRLLYAEKKVNESIDYQLISDEELDFIQHRWILEGDFSLTASKIAKRYNRTVRVSDEDLKLIKYAKALYITIPIWSAKVSHWFNIYADERFAIQFVKQIVEKYSFTKIELLIEQIVECNDLEIVPEYLKQLQLKNQFYPSPLLYDLIMREWKEDKASLLTRDLVRDHEDTWEDIEEFYDPLEDPNISLEDKYSSLDNWTTYVGSDSNERFEHSEYMRYGGNFQYVNFRERQSEENRATSKAKKERKAKKRIVNTASVQQTFAFAF